MRIITQGPEPACFNMALDEAILESVRKKNSPPTLRLYGWDRPSISIGYFQKITEIDAAYCQKHGYPVVRRLTGGRAVLHDAELTYSVSSPHDSYPFNGNLLDNYRTISSALLRGLKRLGIEGEMSFTKKRSEGHRNPACFRAASFGEVTVNAKKIIGSAQKRYTDGFLQHGSILISFDHNKLCNALSRKEVDGLSDICSVSDHVPHVSPADLIGIFRESFERELNIKLIDDSPTKQELTRSQELVKQKYSAREWNYLR